MTGTSRDEVQQAYEFGDVTPEARALMGELRKRFLDLALYVYDTCPPSRARSLALTDLQQAKMWSIQSVVDSE